MRFLFVLFVMCLHFYYSQTLNEESQENSCLKILIEFICNRYTYFCQHVYFLLSFNYELDRNEYIILFNSTCLN